MRFHQLVKVLKNGFLLNIMSICLSSTERLLSETITQMMMESSHPNLSLASCKQSCFERAENDNGVMQLGFVYVTHFHIFLTNLQSKLHTGVSSSKSPQMAS